MGNNDISIVDLVKFHRGETDPEKRRQIEEALKGDARLQQTYLLVRSIGDFSDELGWEQLAEAALKLSEQMFDDFRESIDHGVLIFDSALLPLPEGVRPAAVGTRTLRYRVRELLLDLSLYPITPDSLEIIGRVSNLAPGADKVAVSLKGAARLTAEADAFGIFRFERVARGQWELKLSAKRKHLGAVNLML